MLNSIDEGTFTASYHVQITTASTDGMQSLFGQQFSTQLLWHILSSKPGGANGPIQSLNFVDRIWAVDSEFNLVVMADLFIDATCTDPGAMLLW